MPVDLVRQDLVGVQGGEWQGDRIFYATGESLNLGSPNHYDDINLQGSGMSASVKILPTAVTAGDHLLWKGAAALGGWNFSIESSTGTLQFFKELNGVDVERNSETGVVTNNELHTYGFSWDGGTAFTGIGVFKNGREVASYLTETGGGTIRNDEGNVLLMMSEVQGYLYHAYMWRRKLSDAEHKAIADNPYQFLIPVH
jgi:hypothetical protein